MMRIVLLNEVTQSSFGCVVHVFMSSFSEAADINIKRHAHFSTSRKENASGYYCNLSCLRNGNETCRKCLGGFLPS